MTIVNEHHAAECNYNWKHRPQKCWYEVSSSYQKGLMCRCQIFFTLKKKNTQCSLWPLEALYCTQGKLDPFYIYIYSLHALSIRTTLHIHINENNFKQLSKYSKIRHVFSMFIRPQRHSMFWWEIVNVKKNKCVWKETTLDTFGSHTWIAPKSPTLCF